MDVKRWAKTQLIRSELKRKQIFQKGQIWIKVSSAVLNQPSDTWLTAVKTTYICHSCQDAIVIGRTILPLYRLFWGSRTGWGRESRRRGDWEQTVGLVCFCVLPCLGFHRPDDYRLIPGDSFLTQEILPSLRLTEEVISPLQTTAVKQRRAILRNMPRVLSWKKHHTDVFIKKTAICLWWALSSWYPSRKVMFLQSTRAQPLVMSGLPFGHLNYSRNFLVLTWGLLPEKEPIMALNHFT